LSGDRMPLAVEAFWANRKMCSTSTSVQRCNWLCTQKVGLCQTRGQGKSFRPGLFGFPGDCGDKQLIAVA
jgi:hypothetical protein